jgi:alkanesulfonate monooxygenase SsuD/methylene tetrahydromethanopterin reductase-like flavin-dependent oxidoreductase (luciferase family)
MRFGVHLGPQSLTMTELRQAWREIEDLGFDWISVWDHFYAAAPPWEQPSFEATVVHTALAMETSRVRVGCLVYSAGYRHPAVMANVGVAIDHLSEGRFEIGLGAGWHQTEYDAYGIPFEPPAVRLRRMAEYAEVVRLLWTDDVVDYRGEFYQLEQARCDPKPLQRTPRIWIGARGPRALALAGHVGDGWNIAYVSPEHFARSYEVVRSNCPRPDAYVAGVNVGLMGELNESDREEFLIRRYGSAGSAVADGILEGSTAQMIDRVSQYQDAGADWVIIALRPPIEEGVLVRFATEVIPAFAASEG